MPAKIEKRGENTYRLNVTAGYDGTGKQIIYRKTVTASGPAEAKRLYNEYVADVQRGQVAENKNLYLKEFIVLWLKNHANKHLAPKTVFRYKQLFEYRIIPTLGNLKLDKIRPTHLLSFYDNLSKDGIRKDGNSGGLSERTILHHHRLLHTVLETAVQWQYLTTNPASRVKAPRVPKKSAAVYDEEQTKALLTATQSEPLKYQVIILLAIATGMRQGEIMGLEWQHIDLEKNTIRIEQCAQYLPGKGVFLKDPKNESSKRLISVPKTVIDLVRLYKKEQAAERLQMGDRWKASDRVCTSWDGNPMYPNEMSSWFPKFLARHKLPHLNFHGLRHTSATLLIAEGATATDLSRRLGHSTTSTTMNIYAHSLQKADNVLASKMDSILTGKRGKVQKKGRAK